MKLPEIVIEGSNEKMQLPAQELWNVFYKMEHYFHEEDVESELIYKLEAETLSAEDQSKMESILNDEKAISDLTEYYEERLGDDDSWNYILNGAIKDYLKTYKPEEANHK